MRHAKSFYHYLVLLSLLVCYASVNAQFHHLKFENYTTESGLSNDIVIKTLQDKHRFLWVATTNGLCRYDGTTFKKYTANDGLQHTLRSNWITDLLLDQNGVLWISTEWGICYYDERNDQFQYCNAKNDVYILYKAPMCLDNQNNIWAATENGLLCINTNAKTYKVSELNRIPDPQSIAFFKNQIWIGTRGHGLFVYDLKNHQYQLLQANLLPNHTHIMHLYSEQEHLWAATSIGLVDIIDRQQMIVYNSMLQTPQKKVESLMCMSSFYPITGDSMLLCGSYDKKLYLFHKQKKQFVYEWKDNHKSTDDLNFGIFHQLLPTQDILWIATDRGLSKLNMQSQNSYTYIIPELKDADDGNTLITSILQHPTQPNQLFCIAGRNKSRIILYDKEHKKVLRSMAPSDNANSYTQITYIAGSIWATHKKGIDQFNINGIKKASYPYPMQALCLRTHQQAIWIGTDKSVIQFDTKSHQFDEIELSFKGTAVEDASYPYKFYVSGIDFDQQHQLWLTSGKYGLFKLNTQTKQFKVFRQPSNFQYETKNRCSSISIDSNEHIWIGTMNGLTLFDINTEQFTNYANKNGLESDYVYNIAKDPTGQIWGRGNAGIFSFNPHNQQFNNYAIKSAFNSLFYLQKVSPINKDVYVGFEGGFISLQNATHHSPINPTSLTLTNCTLMNQQLHFNRDSVRQFNTSFPYYQNSWSFAFAALDFTIDGAIQYAYQLKGFDANWITTYNKAVSYTNLPAGKYSFIVKARVGNQPWSAAQTLFIFEVEPAFWQTWWFITLSIVLICTLLTIGYGYRVKQIQQKQAAQTQYQQLQLEQYQQQLEMEKIINYFTTSLANKNTEEEVIWDVAKNLIHQLGFANCMIFLWNEDKTTLLQKAGYGPNGSLDEIEKEAFTAKPWQGIVGHVAATKKPILLGNTSKDPRYRADVLNRLSELCVPAVHDDEVIAVIDSEDFAENYYTTQHLQILTTIATLMASKLVSIKKATEVQRKKEELEIVNKQAIEAELAMLRSQMNPHFIFNSLNSIQRYIWDNKQEDASEYLTKFARLIRLILEHSSKKMITLSEEILALQLYLELEHRRCNNKFDYSFFVDPTLPLDNLLLPPMLIQPHVENAIWHGLLQKPERGHLQISLFSQSSTTMVCVVEDNGIGRQKSAAINARKEHKAASLGTNITQKRLDIIHMLGLTGDIHITDKFTTDGTPNGTIITLQIPIETFQKIR